MEIRRFAWGCFVMPKVSGDANLERLALVAILLFAAALRLWGIDRSGFANTYYAAAVRSMTLSLHNFLYLSF